jgi:uncharacterized membrane protein YeaQ/YmgE (transglycosylase-associated protein family)
MYRVVSCLPNADDGQKFIFGRERWLRPSGGRLESSHQAILARLKTGGQQWRASTGEMSMVISNESILVVLFVGLVAGWLAGKIVRGTGFGIIGDILVGIAGALIASLLFPKLGIHLGTGLISAIIYSAIGAILLLLLVRLIRTGGRL